MRREKVVQYYEEERRKKRSGEEEEEKMHACRSVAVEQRGAKGEREREKD